MRRRAFFLSFVLTWLVGVAAYVIYHYRAGALRETDVPRPGETVLRAPTTSEQGSSARPPPPPPVAGVPLPPPAPEPQRTLTGTTGEQLSLIEQYLPDGAQVATYSAGENHSKAALVTAELDGDGSPETVVVHRGRRASRADVTPQLFLSVLSREGEALKVRSSARLVEGGVLFDIHLNGLNTPLAVQDMTGDGRPEIIVALGVGASLGGSLQVYSVEGLSLRHLGDVGGTPSAWFPGGAAYPGARHHKLLRSAVASNNDATLGELRGHLEARAGVTVSEATVSRALKRLGLPRKKKHEGGGARRL